MDTATQSAKILSLVPTLHATLSQGQVGQSGEVPLEWMRLRFSVERIRALLLELEAWAWPPSPANVKVFEQDLNNLEYMLHEIAGILKPKLPNSDHSKLRDPQHSGPFEDMIPWINTPRVTVEASNLALSAQESKIRTILANTTGKCWDQYTTLAADPGSLREQLDLISPLKPFSANTQAHKENCLVASHETGSWLIGTQTFYDWTEGDSIRRTIRILGGAGHGKSVLTSQCLEHIRRRKSVLPHARAVAYFYFQSSEPVSSDDVLKSLLYQLYLQATFKLERYSATQRELQDWTEISTSELFSVLERSAMKFDLVYFVLEGLDQVIIDQERLHELVKMLESIPSAALLVTSRPIPFPQDLRASFDQINMDGKNVDIRNHVHRSITSMIGRDNNAIEVQTLTDEIVERAQGVFLWVRLAIERLQTCIDAAKPLDISYWMPSTLFDWYTKRLESVTGQPYLTDAISHGCLRLMVGAKRALRAKELIHAIHILLDIENTTCQQLLTAKDIVNACGGLITQDISSANVLFSHSTARDFAKCLVSKDANDNQSPADAAIAAVSLKLLSSEALDESTYHEHEALSVHLDKYPFLQYATNFWGFHIRKCDSHRFFRHGPYMLRPTLADPERRQRLVEIMLVSNSNKSMTTKTDWEFFSVYHIMAWFGLDISWLRRNAYKVSPWRVTVRDAQARSPLHIAAKRGYGTFIENFLDEEGEEALNLTDNLRSTPLHYAVRERNSDAIRTLLRHSCCVDVSDIDGKTPFQYAVEYGDVNTIRTLLTRVGLDELKRLITLDTAIERRQAGLTRFLLSHGWNITDASIFKAVSSHSSGMTELIFSKRGDMHARDALGRTPLHYAIQHKAHGAAQVLLDNSAEGDAVDHDQRTPLIYAAEAGDFLAVKTLLYHDSGINQKDAAGVTPLHLATRKGASDVVTILLRHYADIHAVDNDGNTPMSIATQTGNEEMIARLTNPNRFFD